MSSTIPFSRRTAWDRAVEPLARLRAEMEAAGVAVLDLTESNPTRAGLPYPGERILAALARDAALHYVPDPRGALAARRAIASHLAAGGIEGASAERMVLTASTSEAYAWLFKLLCEPGDEILVPAPSYPLFDFLAQVEGVGIVRYPLEYDGRWRLDAGELAHAATQRSRAVLVVHPNNPTGSMLRETEARELAAFCAERGLAVISDEVFADFPFGDDLPAGTPRSLLGIVGRTALVFSLGGLSKAAGLPQLKLSWILADGPAAEREEALARLEILGDTFLSVGTPVQAGVDALLGAGRAVRDTIRARVRANRAHLEAAASVPGCCWEVLAADGGWYAVVRVPRILTDEQWAMRLLEDERVYVHPGYLFDFPGEGYLVLSLLPPEETFRAAAGRMADRIAREATGEQPR